MGNRHLIVISEDALVFEDLETLKTLPSFGKIWNQTARVERVRSIYPTVTYPCHSTMMTGVYPDRHGVINNEQLIMGEKTSLWTHFRDAVKVPTIFDAAHAKGLSTAAVFWPVTGSHPGEESAIDYLVDEYWPQSGGETSYECFVNSGSSREVMEKIVVPNLPIVDRVHRVHPYGDQFVNACVCDMIREFKPNLLMAHPANIDAYRHQTGVFSPKVTHGLHEIDSWFGSVLKACEDAGIYEETDFVITSDHGQCNIVRAIAPNVMFVKHRLIDVDGNGAITGYRAFCKSAGMSSHIFLKDPSDRASYTKTYELLKQLRDEEVYGISEVFTADEIKEKEHLSGGFSFVIESDGYSSFSNEWTKSVVQNLDVEDYRFARATHGHLPDKGAQPTLFAFGPHIRPGVVLETGRLIDQAPTFARLLGVDMPDTDGQVITEILA
jgi:predicted AlkP superfamily pyrophosphatase or phosphodiesterase